MYDLESRAPRAMGTPAAAAAANINSVVVTQEYLANLEARIAKLEQRADLQDITHPLLAAAATVSSDATPSTGHILTSNAQAQPHLSPHSSTHLGGPSQVAFDQSPAPSSSVIASQQGVFGLNSNQAGDANASDVSFHTLLQTVFPPTNAQHVAPEATSTSSLTKSADDSTPLPPYITAELPTRQEAQAMFDYYWGHTHRIYPFLQQRVIQDKYDALVRDPTMRRIWDAALLMMVFMASERIGGRAINEKSIKYWNVTERILASQPHHRSLVQVQTLILRGLFMQGTDDPAECWHIIGNAVRSAYFIGLHRPDPTMPDFEEKKRTWAVVCIIDANILFALDRPSCISTRMDVYPRVQPYLGEDPRACLFFSHWFDLVQIVKSYQPPPGVDMFSFLHESPTLPVDTVVAIVRDLESKIVQWKARLPPSLCLSEPPEISTLDAVTLSFRESMVRLLVHRPSLHLAVRHASMFTTPQPEALGESVAIIASTAMSTLRVLQRTLEMDVFSAPWWRLYFTTFSVVYTNHDHSSLVQQPHSRVALEDFSSSTPF
ncbi:hypothetical protein OIO90_005484 [Microbotryomycetes sp. JL221]|nr:hypothetical protein OIO90_005484 [Microbotryomycetes sp. JL221]